MEETEKVMKMRHTLSHVMAEAIRELYPEVKLGIGPTMVFIMILTSEKLK